MPTLPDWNAISHRPMSDSVPRNASLSELDKIDQILKLLKQIGPGPRVFVAIHLTTLMAQDQANL